MPASCRFAFAVHVLAVLAYRDSQVSACSDALAGSVNTNPVVIRRLLSQLRNAGLVKTQQGVRGGATLELPPEEITLGAVGVPGPFRPVDNCGFSEENIRGSAAPVTKTHQGPPYPRR